MMTHIFKDLLRLHGEHARAYNALWSASRVIIFMILTSVAVFPLTSEAIDRVCSPASMLKVVASMEVPDAPKGHFVRVPKTLYRYGERYGRIEEARNPETRLHLLIVVSEPDIWIVDLAGRRGDYQKDNGPTYYFRSVIFGDPSIRSRLINSLEFGCEIEWLRQAGAKITPASHPEFGAVQKITYSEGDETMQLFAQSGVPKRLEIHRNGTLYVAVNYLEYVPGMRFDKSLFSRPTGIAFSGEGAK
jgi:hypothetical protein